MLSPVIALPGDMVVPDRRLTVCRDSNDNKVSEFLRMLRKPQEPAGAD